MKILDILNELDSNSSRLFKESVVEKYKNNELFSQCLRQSMDPQIRYFINKTPKERIVDTIDPDQYTLKYALDFIMENFATRKITGNAAKTEYATLLGSLDPDDAVVLERVVKGDLRCGVKTATVNKIFGDDYIYEHPNLLCSPFSEKGVTTLFKKNKYVLCQMKSDGARAQIVIHPDKVVAYSRKGNIIDFRGRLDYMCSIPDLVGKVIDGELLSRTNGIVDNRQTCNGITNKLIQSTISEEELDRVFMTAWDIFPYENMKTKTPYRVPYEQRFANLQQVIDLPQNIFFEMIESHKVYSLEEAEAIYNKWMDDGFEGAILKSPDLIWEHARSKDAIKVKAEETGEFVVYGWEFGNPGTQNEHGLGGLLVATRCGKLRTKIGKGYSQPERDTFFGLGVERADEMIGWIVECNFNSITKGKNKDTSSLFLEKFIKIRLDKTEANSLEELQ